LVGWDAADWKVIDPLLERGEMPALASILAEGVRGNIATLYPPLSPMLWTSIATGKRPTRHGIHGFIEPTPDGMGVRPVSILGRTTKAVWNILNQHGKRSIVVGWWPSHPAEPIRGAMVSNHYPPATSQDPDAPMGTGTVWPSEWAERLAPLRVHGMDVTGEILRMFAPDFGKADQQNDKSIHDLAAIIAETMSIHAAATDLIEHEAWDFAGIYYAGIDHFSHRFMRYHAGKARAKEQSDPALFQAIVANAYRYHDAMLGRLLQLAGPDCAVMVLSDHGFHSGRLLPDYIPAEAAGPAVEHRHFGIFAMRAPGVLKGERVYGASVLDIAPTVLHLFGLPPGNDMDGKVLINAFTDHRLPPRIATWDEVPGEDGRHPEGEQYDGLAAAESLKQLVALGYIAPPGEDARKSVDECITENRYNLARAWMDAGASKRAEEILRELVGGDPEEGRFHQHLVECLLQQGDWKGCTQVLNAFDCAAAEFGPRAAKELERRRAEKPDNDLVQHRGPDQREMHERRVLAEKAGGFAIQRLMLRCRLAVAQPRQKAAARALLEELAAQTGLRRPLSLFLAQNFLAVKEHDRALEFVRRARRVDPENWEALTIEARIHHAAGRHNDAANCAIESLSLVYFQPFLHYLLGLSLRHLGDEQRAAHSLRVALAQAPEFPAAHDELAKILRRKGNAIGQASLHMAQAEQIRKRRRGTGLLAPPPETHAPSFSLPDRSRLVTVVSGLPRSGTSMMMQILAAAGLEPFTDQRRAPDEDNPRGYLEHENATRLDRDPSWIPQVRGRAVKIVAQLLPHLPANEEYRVIFLHRKLEEVVASQRAMLARLGRNGAHLTDAELMRTYTRQLIRVQNWLRSHPEIPVLAIKYDEALHDPEAIAVRLAGFLGEPFDERSAAGAIDAALKRQRY
jgi:predicted AlkP superfamily phosphohydrolase/phosphomutase/tetratricopeptide (TPR) repeat protein